MTADRPQTPEGDARPGRDHILVVGPSKTGTTGVYATIKAALAAAGHDYVTVFEPKQPETIDSLFARAPQRPVLAKATMDKRVLTIPDPLAFDRRLTTVRDPRDTLISTLLFRPLTLNSLGAVDETAVARFVEALRRKEREPHSVSVMQLFALAEELGIGGAPFPRMRRDLAAQRELVDSGGFRIVHYERFVEGDFTEFAGYLGVTPDGAASSSTYGHIARSKGSGAFRHWFVPDDLRACEREFGAALDAFGYPRDVELAANPVIDPATSSAYVEQRYRQRREQARTRREFTIADPVTSEAEYADLLDAAGDGSAKDCLRLAHVHLRGDRGEPDPGTALVWARRSAELGLAAGVALTVDLLEQQRSGDPAVHRELRRWRVWNSPDGGDRARAELARLRSSMRHRIGTLVVDAARDPRQNAMPALRSAAQLWRARRGR